MEICALHYRLVQLGAFWSSLVKFDETWCSFWNVGVLFVSADCSSLVQLDADWCSLV